MGDHTATQNIGMNGYWISDNTGNNRGIFIESSLGKVGIGLSNPGELLHVGGGMITDLGLEIRSTATVSGTCGGRV